MIRPATEDDARGIASVHVLAWQAAYRGLVPDEHLDALSIEDRRELWDRVLAGAADRRQRIWVTEEDGITGFVCVGPSRDADADPSRIGELQAIYVHPDAWGRGDGRLLHDTGVAWLRTAGYDEATLWMVDGNVRAAAFYARQGWRPDGAAKHEVWEGVPMDEIRYRLTW